MHAKPLFITLLAMLLFSCSDTPVHEYLPKNGQEKEIVSLVTRYLNAKKAFDEPVYLSCLHDDGEFHFAHWRYLSKQQVEKRLPEFWRRLKAKDQTVYPMAREDLIGDFIPSGRYVNPEIATDKNTAVVTMRFTAGAWGQYHYVHVAREYDRWLITRLEWQQN